MAVSIFVLSSISTEYRLQKNQDLNHASTLDFISSLSYFWYDRSTYFLSVAGHGALLIRENQSILKLILWWWRFRGGSGRHGGRISRSMVLWVSRRQAREGRSRGGRGRGK